MFKGEGSDLLGPLFGDADVAEQLSDRARLQAMLDVEAALADVEAELGVVPRSAVEPIRAAADAGRYDVRAIAAAAARDGNLAIPLVRHLTKDVEAIDASAARYVHWGATSQDILDTGLVLQLQRAVPPILAHLDRAAAAAASHARRHVDTVMAGRTWLQHATPVTFGVKAAGWLDALMRQRASLALALEEARVVQFGGASGTLAALGDQGIAVADRLASRLGLAAPDVPWHAHRDRLARLACALGVTCGTLGKIARDVSLLAQTEVGEAAEQQGGGSSAMPHKRNPIGASVALAAAVRAPGLVATLLAAMPQEHERGLGGWQAEWTTLPELVLVTAGASRAVASMLDGLVVDAARMRENLERTGGLIASERVSMALAAHVGRTDAHRLVEHAAERTQGGGTFADALAGDPDVTRHLTRDEIERQLSAESYVGAVRALVERVLRRFARS
ncbi:MAG TPA: 3-carboxy-cis,cis-muconate cycloisomerase [Vicinamibacterales bacterium]|nr:3-carboxy-cis,cis-muconate cycloisomerase [Vicinamibacterales bacterium]